MYALMAAEEQSVTAWHLFSCDIIENAHMTAHQL